MSHFLVILPFNRDKKPVTKAKMTSEATFVGPILEICSQIDASGTDPKPQMRAAIDL